MRIFKHKNRQIISFIIVKINIIACFNIRLSFSYKI